MNRMSPASDDLKALASISAFCGALLLVATVVTRFAPHSSATSVSTSKPAVPSLPKACEEYLARHEKCIEQSVKLDRQHETALVAERRRAWMAVATAARTDVEVKALELSCVESRQVLDSWCR